MGAVLLAAMTLTAIATMGTQSAKAAILINSVTSATDYSNFVNSGSSTIPNLGNRLIDFNSTPFSSGSLISTTPIFLGENQEAAFSGRGRIVTGSRRRRYAAPAADTAGDGTTNNTDNTPYLAIGGRQERGPVQLSFKYPIISTLGFLWGSVDSYNSVRFQRGSSLLAEFTGSDVINFPTGDRTPTGTRFVNFVAEGPSDYFDTVIFGSSRAAFELDDIRYTEVPTPALLPGLVGIGVAALRKRKQSGETTEA